MGNFATPLYLDDWLADYILLRCPEKERELLAALPFETRIKCWQGLALAASLEEAARCSLHYKAKLSEKPGREALTSLSSFLRGQASACFSLSGEDLKRQAAVLEAGIHQALSGLPFTFPAELAAQPESFLSISHDEVASLYSFSSSGSTGPGKRIFCTVDDLEGTMQFFEHGMGYLLDPGRDRVALLMSTLNPARGGNLGDLFGRAMQRLGTPCLVAGFPGDDEQFLQKLLDFKPTCLVGLPRHIISLLRFNRCVGEALKSGIHTVLLSGDAVSPVQRRVIEAEASCKVFSHYGLAETGLGTAVECRERAGCHYREADMLFEIIMGNGQSYALPGQQEPTPWGEITVTTLTRAGTPLIRYRTGDIGRILPGGCACGSVLRRLEVRGRKDNIIAFSDEGGEDAVCCLSPELLDSCLYPLSWVVDYELSYAKGGSGTRALCSIKVNHLLPFEHEKQLRDALGPVRSMLPAHADMYAELIMPEGEDIYRPFWGASKKIFSDHLDFKELSKNIIRI